MNLVKYNITIGGRSSVVEHPSFTKGSVLTIDCPPPGNTMKEQKNGNKNKANKILKFLDKVSQRSIFRTRY